MSDLIDMMLCFNTDNLFLSLYSGPVFNSFCLIDGEVYAAGDLGIYKITGDTDGDDAFYAGILWEETDFSISNKKRIRAAILNGDVDNTAIQVKTNEDDETFLYDVVNNRASIGRACMGRDWTIKVSDFDRLDSIEFFPVVRGR